MTGEANHLLTDPLLKAPVTDKRIGKVVHQIIAKACAQKCFRDSHPHRIGNTLPELTRRDFDASLRI